MPATVTSITPRRASGPTRAPEAPRRPFRDNPRLILAGIGILVVVLIALLAIASGTSRFSPDFLSEFVLYGLSAADLTMLAALVVVLAPEVTLQRVQIVEVYRVVPSTRSLPSIEPVVDVAAPALPPGHSRAAVDRLAAQAVAGAADARSIETLGTSGDLLHAAAVIRGK